MIGSIPNPKKSITVEFPLATIKESVKYINDFESKYRFLSSNEILNLYTYEATELLSLGVYIDINLASKGDNSTEINLEVRRKLGTFDKSHEVTLAHQHIDKILLLITQVIQLPEDHKQQLREKHTPKEAATTGQASQKFNCGVCKKEFYTDNSIHSVVICPHCKKTNSLPSPVLSKGCMGVFTTLLMIGFSTLYFFFTFLIQL